MEDAFEERICGPIEHLQPRATQVGYVHMVVTRIVANAIGAHVAEERVGGDDGILLPVDYHLGASGQVVDLVVFRAVTRGEG